MGKFLNEIISHGIFIEDTQQRMEKSGIILELKSEIQSEKVNFIESLKTTELQESYDRHFILLTEAHNALETAYCDMAFKKGIGLGVRLIIELLTE